MSLPMSPETACAVTPSSRRVIRRHQSNTMPNIRSMAVSILALAPGLASAQCVSLQGSTACPAWQGASVTTTSTGVDRFSFLQFVTDRVSFDRELTNYVNTTYVTEKYQALFGCGNIDFSRSSEFYARFTKTAICGSIVQLSKDICGVPDDAAKPVCADTCAQFAQSESFVSSDTSLCPNPGPDLVKLIRADFITCSLPEKALSSGSCIQGIENEPENCGFDKSTVGLCQYCATGGLNSTDTCCFNSDVDTRCEGIELPNITSTMTFTLPAPTETSSVPQPETGGGGGGLSGGKIAGIVIGSLAGALLIAGLIYMCLGLLRRRRGSQNGSIFNQPSPARQGPATAQVVPAPQQGHPVLPGGRIARMSALEDPAGEAAAHNNTISMGGIGSGSMRGRRRGDNLSSSDEFDSPEPEVRTGILRPPPTNIRRHGSLSSNSVLAGEDPQSPTSAGMSSPQGMASQQSEQLPFFRDYYSQDDIHPGDRVAVLWAYQPRAADEFSLERGDMLKVVGIWDDGWATGIMIDERADEWEARRQAQRDSGVSNTSGRRDASPPVSGEIKAFPLVCVCLPEHWRKTVEGGESSTETGSSGHQPSPSGLS